MSQPTLYHIPVMLKETLEHLITTPDGIYVDGTLGGGGHAEKICERLHTNGTLIGIDADTDASQQAGKRLQRFQTNVQLVNENTAHIASILRSRNISTINGLLLDLGVSSFQLDEAKKGFSFRLRFDFNNPELRLIALLMLPATWPLVRSVSRRTQRTLGRVVMPMLPLRPVC